MSKIDRPVLFVGTCHFCGCIYQNSRLRITKCREDGMTFDAFICDRCIQDQRDEDFSEREEDYEEEDEDAKDRD